MSVTLRYFNGAGRAEVSRMVLRLGDVRFNDVRYSQEEFGKLKADVNSEVWSPVGMGSVPVLSHGDFHLCQSQAIAMYCGDLALRGGELTSKQRGTDMMFLGTYTDLQSCMYKCLFGTEESKAKGKEALKGAVKKFVGFFESQLPNRGFLHGRNIPSVGDVAVYNNVHSPFPGLLALGVDLSAYPKVQALCKAVDRLLNPPVVLQYFDTPGRTIITRLALRIGGVDFKDVRYSLDPKDTTYADLKKDPNSSLWKPCGMGSVPILTHGDYTVTQSQAVHMYANDLALKGDSLTVQQKAVDFMFLGTHADMLGAILKCQGGAKEALDALPGAAKKYLGFYEKQLPDSGFLHGRDIPSVGDLAVFVNVEQPDAGLKALGVDVSMFPKVLALCDLVRGLKGCRFGRD